MTFEPLLHNGMSFSELDVLDSERDCLWVEAGSWLATSTGQSLCSGIIRDCYHWWTVTSESFLHNGMSFSELSVLDLEMGLTVGRSWPVGWLPAQCRSSHVCSGIIHDSYRWWTVTSVSLLHNGMSFFELGVVDSERDCLWVEAAPLG